MVVEQSPQPAVLFNVPLASSRKSGSVASNHSSQAHPLSGSRPAEANQDSIRKMNQPLQIIDELVQMTQATLETDNYIAATADYNVMAAMSNRSRRSIQIKDQTEERLPALSGVKLLKS